MNLGVIGYLKSKNIGDYVKTLSVINLINQDYTILERECLNNYKGKKTKTIINGWFMEKPLNFPPSTHIDPLFISFHIFASHGITWHHVASHAIYLHNENVELVTHPR